MPAAQTIIPELAVTDPAAARAMLCATFGFTGAGDLLTLGTQSIALIQAAARPVHGRIDHLALAVNDVDTALASLRARGAALDDTTPEGPNDIPEFWESGVRYVFLQGPEGARIELCAKRPPPATACRGMTISASPAPTSPPPPPSSRVSALPPSPP